MFFVGNFVTILRERSLRAFLLLALGSAIVFPVYLGMWVYPRFADEIIKDAEALAVRTASHLSSRLDSSATEIQKNRLPGPFIGEMADHIQHFHLENVKVFSRTGEVVYSTIAKDIGSVNRHDYFHNIVAKGHTFTKVVAKDAKTMEGRQVTRDVVETYVPIMREGTFQGAYEIYMDITERRTDLDRQLRLAFAGVMGLSAILTVMVVVLLLRVSQDMRHRRDAQEEAEQSKVRLADAQRIAKVGDWRWDVAKGTESWSEQMFRIMGLPPRKEPMAHETFMKAVHPDDWDAVRLAMEGASLWNRPFDVEFRLIHGDGMVRYVETHGRSLHDSKDAPVIVAGTLQDITERKTAEIELRESEERYRKLVETTNVVAWEMDYSQQTFSYVSAHGFELLGFPIDAWLSPDFWAERLCPEDREEVLDQRALAVAEGRDHEQEYRLMAANGHEVWVRDIVTVVTLSGMGQMLRGFMIDVTERKELELRIKHMASHDGLTGLPNRALFVDRVERALTRAQRNGTLVAVLFVDLDGFKKVNDGMGHEAGDILLMQVAERLTACVRKADTVGRHGGDEFTILLADMTDLGAVNRVAETILKRLAEPIALAQGVARIGASIGISVYLRHGETPEELVSQADAAMYGVKARGKNSYMFATPKESGGG